MSEREREREIGREREREKEGEGGRERGREGEGAERVIKRGEREWCPELLFLFLKGITNALAPFSYLVYLYSSNCFTILWIVFATNFANLTFQPKKKKLFLELLNK